MAMDSETRLIQSAKAGNIDAFERALRPHLPMLFAYSRAICGDFHVAEDVVQETSQIAYRKLNYLIPEADFAGWLKAIARRQALAARRKLTKTNLVTEEVIERVYQDPLPATGGRRGEALIECIDQLEGRSAHAVKAHYFEGIKVSDLAPRLEMTPVAVRQLLHRVRTLLLECVRRRLGAESLT
jgi:RNA polymerase sigma-70 factor (ECF subfamily)